MDDNKKVVAVYCESNFSGIEILDIEYNINDLIIYRYNFGEPQKAHKAKIYYNSLGEPYFKTCKGYRVYLKDCMKV